MELSEEEKKAIDDLFALTHINGYIDLYTQKKAKIHTLDLSKWQNGVKVLLNLINKQQNKIKDLEDENNFLKEMYRGTTEYKAIKKESRGTRVELIEEEKEAIKTLEEILKEWQKIVDIEDPIERECEMSCYMEDMPFYQIKILLKLVEKQQNKIDAKEMEHQYDQKMIDDLKGEMVHNWIHKDKIRKLLKSKDIELTGVISYRELEELL